MNRRIAIGAIVGALLMSGLLVGVSSGRSASITQPTVLTLRYNLNGQGSHVEFLALDDFGGQQRGQMTLAKAPLFDPDGNEVGRQEISCVASAPTGWVCTFVSRIKDGPNTDRGTIVATGNLHSLAVTGGTAAYSNVGGRAKLENVSGERYIYTLFLVP